MDRVYLTAGTALVVMLCAFALTLILQLADGTINTRGMLHEQEDGGPPLKTRQLLLYSSMALAFGYFVYGLKTGPINGHIPDLPDELLPFLGGTNLAYLSGKFMRLQGLIR